MQFERFQQILKFFPNIKHGISSSYGIVCNKNDRYNFALDIVRCGASLYGIKHEYSDFLNIKNVVSIYAPILQRYSIKHGEYVGYDATYQAKKDMNIAIIGIGYGDGIMSDLCKNGSIIVCDYNNNRYNMPIIGKISMDSLACDATNIPDDLQEFAIIIDDHYTINDLAKQNNISAYEALVRFMKNRRVNIDYK